MPKFPGDSDDWFDDESTRKGIVRKKKLNLKKKKTATQGEKIPSNAIVTEVFRNQCQVRTDASESLICSYRRADLFYGIPDDAVRERAPVTVGDRVGVEVTGKTTGVVGSVEPRKNRLVRLSPERENVLHVVASNIDLVAIVASVHNPDFHSGVVDRFWIAAQTEKIPALLILNKMDLALPDEHPANLYEGFGLPVIEASAITRFHLEDLKEVFKNKRVVLCGHSGVGKTSILAQLTKEVTSKVGIVNEVTGKGKHTTTVSKLFETDFGAELIDTPGVREFALSGVSDESLGQYFSEFQNLECTKNGCLHKRLSEASDVDPTDTYTLKTVSEGVSDLVCNARGLPRYLSYANILESLNEEKSER